MVIKRSHNRSLCVCHCNQHVGGRDEDHLMQMYLVERKRMKNW